ncbi:MAG: hypothetical protein DWH81_03490 [Planctomycetota bacterium]|nr:MAG: hypothetical protein DWH81_03490 [Planctomycetota bacterium]
MWSFLEEKTPQISFRIIIWKDGGRNGTSVILRSFDLNPIQCVDHHGWECSVDWMLSDNWAGFHEFAIMGARPGLTC